MLALVSHLGRGVRNNEITTRPPCVREPVIADNAKPVLSPRLKNECRTVTWYHDQAVLRCVVGQLVSARLQCVDGGGTSVLGGLQAQHRLAAVIGDLYGPGLDNVLTQDLSGYPNCVAASFDDHWWAGDEHNPGGECSDQKNEAANGNTDDLENSQL